MLELTLGPQHWAPNTEHRHSALSFVTPEQRHQGEDVAILAQRRQVFAQARERHPLRWKGATRAWTAPDHVWLNPPAKTEVDRHGKAA